MDFNIGANWDFSGLDFDFGPKGVDGLVDSLSKETFDLEDRVLGTTLAKTSNPYYVDPVQNTNLSLQEQEWFTPEKQQTLDSFFEKQEKSFAPAFTADSARSSIWYDAQQSLSRGVDPDKVFNLLDDISTKTDSQLIKDTTKVQGRKVNYFQTLEEEHAKESVKNFTEKLNQTYTTDTDAFNEQFNTLPLQGQLNFLLDQYNRGEFESKDQYETAYMQLVNEDIEKRHQQKLQQQASLGVGVVNPTYRTTGTGGAQFVKINDKIYLDTTPHHTADYESLKEPDFYSASDGLHAIGGERTKDFDPKGGFLSDIGIFRMPLAIATGGASELVFTGAKALSGETLKTSDWLTLATGGLKASGMLEAPTATTAGKGLTIGNKALTYDQSVGLLNVAAGNPTGAALQLYGGDLINEGLDKAGLDRATIENAGIQYDDFQAGIGKVVSAVAGGAELDNALASGLGTYIREGGTLGIDAGVIEDVVRDVVRPIGKIGTEIAKFVENAVPDVDTSALDPIEDAIRQAGRTTEDVVRAGGRAVDQAVIQPTREVAKAFDDAVIQPVGDAFSALDTAVRQALPSTSIDLPSLNIPNFNPNLGQFSLVSDTGVSTPSPTRTTDQIFGDDLFKFETEIGISYPNEEEYVDLEANPFNDSLELKLTYPDSTEESDGFFEGTIYEQQPRSYNF